MNLEDVRIYYDVLHGRWVALDVSWNCNVGYVDFAVSDTSNPRAGWSLYYYDFPHAVPSLPTFGNSTDKFSIGFHLYDPDLGCSPTEDEEVDLYAFSWADVFNGGTFSADAYTLPTGVLFNGQAYSPRSIAPALQQPASSAVLYSAAVMHNATTASDNFWHLKISGLPPNTTASIQDLTRDGVVRSFAGTIEAEQGGGKQSLQTSQHPSAIWRAGRLVLVMTERCTRPGDIERDCVRIVDLMVPSNGVVTVRQDTYLGEVGKFYFSPGAAFSESGSLYVSFSRSSQTDVPSAHAVRQAIGDVSSISAMAGVQSSNGYMDGFYGAQFIGAAADPLVPDGVWVTGATAAILSPWRSAVAQLTSSRGDTYVPIAPTRILDTRTGTGLVGTFKANLPRTLKVAGAASGLIPANAVAITGNLTVAKQTAAGYVTVGPTSTANPTSSTINFPLGDNRANNLTLPLSANGNLSAVYKAASGKSTELILDVTGYFLADDSGATYKPLTSARILDSRDGTGVTGRFVSDVPKSFPVRGVGGVPAGAIAVTGNLTVVGQTKAGFVALTPAPDATPETSTLNFPVGDVRANGVTVPLSPTGRLAAVYHGPGGSTDLVFDVTGYYVAGTSGLRFYPLNPGRIMDTRSNTLTQLFGAFTSSTPRTLVTGGHFGVSFDALAVTGNLTVVGQTKAGFVAITKDPDSTPPVSTINFPLVDIRANGITVPLNAANDMALVYKATSGAKTHLILDLTGYFR